MKNVLKMLVAISIFLSSSAFPVSSFAILHEDRVNLHPNQAASGIISTDQSRKLPEDQVKQSNHTPGEFIIKFKDEAIIGAVASELVQRNQAFREITGNPHLDDLNARYKVKAMHRVFGKKRTTEITTGSIDIATAKTLHSQQHDQFKAEVAAFREKRFKRKGLQKSSITEEENVPYLGSVYRVEVDPETDIEETCRNYAQDPDVAYCQPNYRMEAQWVPNDPYYSSSGSWGQSYDDMWGLKKLQMATAWDTTKGAGVVVAVVDTGIDNTHPDIAANIWTNNDEIAGNGIDDDGNGFIDDTWGWNFVSNNNSPVDGFGHGTHCAGTIAAIGNNGIGVIGVASSAKIMPIKGLSDSGSGSSSNLAAGIRYAADNGADVISNSWGCNSTCPSNPVEEDAVKYAHDLGAVVVFAAGNNGQSYGDVTQYSPQNQSNSVITVAASTELDTRSYFSTIGSLIAVAAPGGGADGTSSNHSGINILSLRAGATDMYGGGTCIVGGNYYRSRGTSMAAPHVAGVAALVLANHPEFTPDDVKQVLQVSADDIESSGFDLLSGAGRVNAQKAVSIASVPKVRITSPIGSFDVSSGTVTINGDAYGTNFAKYQLFYATIDKTNSNPYAPVLGSWQALGAESSQSVTNGVLGSFNSSLFQTGLIYLIKLEVTTTDNLKFIDIKEITPYIPDTTPNQFTFTAQTGVPLSTVITSNTITVSGIYASTPISITGGTYSINGGTYTSVSGTVVNGNTVSVRLTSSSSYSATMTATLNIGGVTGTFSVTTLSSQDTTPNSFTLTAQTGVALNTVITSNAITVSGINAVTPISITGGTYSINSGTYTSDSGTVSNGDTVTVQQTSSGSYATTTTATLTIGGVSGAFNVTTQTENPGAPNTWIQKADFGGVGRYHPAGFSIGNKGYFGTGSIYNASTFTFTLYQDFWEYDTNTGVWTQKADFVGGTRYYAVGFSIGSKGYIGTGQDSSSSYKKDFWEYDPATNIWTRKADFGGTARRGAVGFSINNKGYVGTGYNSSWNKDFWEYDQITNIWTRKADFGGTARSGAVGFSIGNKGYIGTGDLGTGNSGTTGAKDFWEYDPAVNTWTQRTDFGGTGRSNAVGFSIGGKGYIGTGYDNTSSSTKDFWEYDSAANTWTKKADFGGGLRSGATGFSIGSNGYMGTGSYYNNSNGSSTYYQDFWEYTPTDTTPDIFTFTDQTGVALSIVITSNTITVSGINAATPISITGGTYSINGGTYTSSSGTVVDGNTVTVRLTSSGSYSTTTNATLTIGGVSGAFNVTTLSNDATSVTMTFEGLTDGEIVGDYYNGGYGYDYNTRLPKSGPGPNYGVVFSTNIQTGINTNSWRGEPTPHTAIGFQQGGAWINVPNGFTGGLSLYYGNVNSLKKIYIYDGLNRTGNILATLEFSTTSKDSDGAWLIVYKSVNFTGTARSIDFTECQNSCVVDDITLRLVDTTPDQFTFTAQTGVPLSTVITSNTITVSGINAAAPISITGGTYSINGGAYTSASGIVANGNTVTVQLTSSASYFTTTNAILTIGGVSGTFSVTTFQLTPIIPIPPTTGPIGGTIILNGSNFGATQGGGYVDFNGIHGIIVSWSDTQIVVTVPVGATSGCMKIVTDYGTSDCIGFTIVTESLYGSFTGAGIWKWDSSTWTQLTPYDPQMMTVSGGNLYAAFTGYGISQWVGSAWTQLTPYDPQMMTTSGSNLYAAFTGYGISKWDGSTWTQLTPYDPQMMTVSDGNLYAAFTGYGISQWDGKTWTQLTPYDPQMMTASGGNLYAAFTGYGISQWDGSTWTQLTPYDPQMMTVSGSNLYAAFTGYGISKWDGSTWTQITPNTPQSMVASGENLYGGFGNGIWKWDGSTWTQLTPYEPAIMVVGN
jgi:subtilisin family serine protease/N-acetylneuraminic acid mutarotase